MQPRLVRLWIYKSSQDYSASKALSNILSYTMIPSFDCELAQNRLSNCLDRLWMWSNWNST